MRIRPLLRPVLLLALAPAAFAADRPLANVRLAWKPTNKLADSLSTLNLLPYAKIRIAVAPFADHRKDKALIGENIEGDQTKPVTTQDDVAAFLTERTRLILREAGLPITEKVEEAQVVVSAEVLHFKVTEGGTYQGEVSLLVSVQAQGQELWRGTLLGSATRWGRSYKLENYYEALCNSLLEAVANGLKNEGLLKALAGKSAS